MANPNLVKGHIPWNKGLKGFMAGKKHYLFGKKRPGVGGCKRGHTAWNKGKKYPHSKEWAEKVSKAMKGRKTWNFGKKQPDSYKRKMALWRVNHKDDLRRGAFTTLKILSKRKKTKPEKELIILLKKAGVRHVSQYLINNRFLVDEYLPEYNTVIEVDGNYWHSLPKIVNKDKAENAYLKKCGYRVIRISEKDISNFAVATLFKAIGAKERG